VSASDLEIVYQDEQILVVNKPSGLLALPGRGKAKYDSVTSRVREMFPECMDQPAVHRLDMDTSGLMLLAFDRKSHANLSRQFQERRVYKRYIALLDGELEGESGVIELPFRLDVENRPYQIYDPVHGKVGITKWRKLELADGKTRVEFLPETGRTHQLRVHSAHEKGLGIPIVGDTLYGGHPRHGELKLHSTKLRFTHPVTGAKIVVQREPGF